MLTKSFWNSEKSFGGLQLVREPWSDWRQQKQSPGVPSGCFISINEIERLKISTSGRYLIWFVEVDGLNRFHELNND